MGAEREAHAAVDLVVGVPAIRPDALAFLSRALLAQGRSAEALDTAREAISGLEATGAESGEARIRLALAEALIATGDVPGARAALVAAKARLEQRAARISDERLRRSFLENVPEHALTFALAARSAEPR